MSGYAGAYNSANSGPTGGQYNTMPGNEMPWIDADGVSNGSDSTSYLYGKVKGSHIQLGGGGQQMPTNGTLAQEDLDILVDWINAGAPEIQ